MDLHEVVMNLPYAGDLKGSQKQAELYEVLLFKYYEHRDEANAEEHLCAVIQFLIFLENPSDTVVTFLVKYEPVLKQLLTDARLANQLPQLAKLAKQMEPNSKPVERAAKDFSFEFGSKTRFTGKPKLYSSLNYTSEYADLTIIAGKKEFKTVFEVHTPYLTKHCLVLGQRIKERFKDHKEGVKRVLEEPEINPVALDSVLCWLYGDHWKLPKHEKEALMLLTNCVDIAAALNLQPLVVDIVESLTKTFDYRSWSLEIIPTIVFLYSKGEITPPIRIPLKRLGGLVRSFWAKNQLARLQNTLKAVKLTGNDGKPVPGHAEFFQDMSIALITIVNDFESFDKKQ
ncbi:hypothetical protein AA313_de0202087 [Arthrobotrys entomopaga]|nr:hypothetical protein AA313_de0202087 [Arthrobotrys entomopaga]